MPPRPSWEEQIPAVLEWVLTEGGSEAAEHLLRALEAPFGGTSPGTLPAGACPAAVREPAQRRPGH